MTGVAGIPLPDGRTGTAVVPAPGGGPGTGTGAPSAVFRDGVFHLAFRLRRGAGDDAVVVARSEDGVTYTVVATVDADRCGAGSLGRPALVVTPPGRWRLYVSCATPGTEHRRVELLEAGTPEGLADAPSVTVLPGDDGSHGRPGYAVTDPVVQSHGGRWHLWAAVHPLDDPGRTTAEYATSPDGVSWTWEGTALAPVPGRWDPRGVRISSVVDLGDRLVATYDGRADAAEEGEERTGAAVGAAEFGRFTAVGDAPAAPGVSLRHLDVVALPGGGYRLYYEITGDDGMHELRTELLASGFLTGGAGPGG